MHMSPYMVIMVATAGALVPSKNTVCHMAYSHGFVCFVLLLSYHLTHVSHIILVQLHYNAVNFLTNIKKRHP